MATVGEVKYGGTSGSSGAKRSVCLLAAATAANGVPALATAGVPAYPTAAMYGASTGAFYGGEAPERSTLNVHTTGGSTPSATFRLWGYSIAAATWYVVKAINAGAAVTAPAGVTDQRYSEVLTDLGHFDRLYLEILTVSGAGTGIEAWLTSARGAS